MATIKLAEALLRRKELQGKVDRLKTINREGLFETRIKRVNVTDSTDEVTAAVPKISAQQVTHCYNWHARQLREIDAAIQRANWTTDVEVPNNSLGEYVDPYVGEGKG